MKKKSNKKNENQTSLFTDLDKDIQRENQVYVNQEIMDAVLDAKKNSAEQRSNDTDTNNIQPKHSTLKNDVANIRLKPLPKKDPDSSITQADEPSGEPHPDDADIYESLFAETTIVSSQIYTYEIDRSLGEDNYSSDCAYRVGQDTTDIGSIFTITRKQLKKPINVSRPHPNDDIVWYNDLAGAGYSYAAVCGTTVQGVIICEPQYWNNTLYIRHLMVAKQHRLKGIGAKLIEEMAHRAQVEGFRALALEVTSANGAAIDFYKKMHFNIVGINAGLYSNSDLLKEEVGIFMHRIIV